MPKAGTFLTESWWPNEKVITAACLPRGLCFFSAEVWGRLSSRQRLPPGDSIGEQPLARERLCRLSWLSAFALPRPLQQTLFLILRNCCCFLTYRSVYWLLNELSPFNLRFYLSKISVNGPAAKAGAIFVLRCWLSGRGVFLWVNWVGLRRINVAANGTVSTRVCTNLFALEENKAMGEDSDWWGVFSGGLLTSQTNKFRLVFCTAAICQLHENSTLVFFIKTFCNEMFISRTRQQRPMLY